jgi:thiamine pyrophosphate-dependent acetolactate synthase large subunit-like protein
MGPVWIDIPLDVQAARVDETKLKGYEPELKSRTSPSSKARPPPSRPS